MRADQLPMTSAMAALRTLRKAAWGHVEPTDVAHAHQALIEPLGGVEHCYGRLSRRLAAHESRPDDPDTWQDVLVALRALDGALGALHGPSGWERPRIG